MFTGIIKYISKIHSLTYDSNNTLELTLYIDFIDNNNLTLGDSIAVNGVCLTIIGINGNYITFQVMEETLIKTNLGSLKKEDSVNVEKAVRENERLDGHIITGHVDTIGIIKNISKNSDNSTLFYIEIQEEDYNNLLINRGSIALNGISLTIAEKFKNEFMVSIIPYSLENTILKFNKIGDKVNLEFDLLLKKTIENDNLIVKQNLKIVSDDHAMSLALQLGLRGKLTAPPNPWVGCLIVKNQRIVSWGYHKKAGEPHAEINAIQMALDNNYNLEDCVLYCTLEPCSHYGRTPPCCNEIIKRKIKKVYIGTQDPDERVQGNGIKLLEENGIKVYQNILKKEVDASLKEYLIFKKEKRPYIRLKMAMSIDGKIASYSGESKWISGEEAREKVHNLRNLSQAIVIGSKTALLDNPKLNVRLKQEIINKPIRIVLDTFGSVYNSNTHLYNLEIGPSLFFTSNKCNPLTINFWEKNNIDYKIVKINKNNKLNLNEILDELYKLGCMQILVEGGAILFSEFQESDLWDEIIIHQGQFFLGNQGIDCFQIKEGIEMNNRINLNLHSSKLIGQTIENIYKKK